jgi:hypothetical protein
MTFTTLDAFITEFSMIGAKKSFGMSDKVFFFKELSYLLKG